MSAKSLSEDAMGASSFPPNSSSQVGSVEGSSIDSHSYVPTGLLSGADCITAGPAAPRHLMATHSLTSPSSFASSHSSGNGLGALPSIQPPFSRPLSSSSFSSTSSMSSVNSVNTPSSSYLPSATTASSTYSMPPPGLSSPYGHNQSLVSTPSGGGPTTQLTSSNQSQSQSNQLRSTPTRLRPAPINVAKANENIVASAPSPRAAIIAGLRSATDRRYQQRAAAQQQQMTILQAQQQHQPQLSGMTGLLNDYPQPPFSHSTHSKQSSFNSSQNVTTPVASGYATAMGSTGSVGNQLASPYYANFGLTSPAPLVDPNEVLLSNLSLSPPGSPLPMERSYHQQNSSQERVDPRQIAALQQKQQELLAASRLISQQQQRIQVAMAQAMSGTGGGLSYENGVANSGGYDSANNSGTNSPVQGYAGLASPGYSASHRASPVPSLHQLTQTIQQQQASQHSQQQDTISNISNSYLYDYSSTLVPPSLNSTFMTQQQSPNQNKHQYPNNHQQFSSFGYASNQIQTPQTATGVPTDFDSFGGSAPSMSYSGSLGTPTSSSFGNYNNMLINPPNAPFHERSASNSGSRPSSPSYPARPSSSISLKSLIGNTMQNGQGQLNVPSYGSYGGNSGFGSFSSTTSSNGFGSGSGPSLGFGSGSGSGSNFFNPPPPPGNNGFGSGSGFAYLSAPSPLGNGGKRTYGSGTNNVTLLNNGNNGAGSSQFSGSHHKSSSVTGRIVEGTLNLNSNKSIDNKAGSNNYGQGYHKHGKKSRTATSRSYKISQGYNQAGVIGSGLSLGSGDGSRNGSTTNLSLTGGITGAGTGSGARTGVKYKAFEVPERQPYQGPAVDEIQQNPSLNFALFNH